MYHPSFCATGTRIHIGAWGLAGMLCALLTLPACGDGGGSSSSTAEDFPTPAATPTPRATPAPAATQTRAPASPQTVAPVSAADAARLLEQATFGVTASDIAHVQSIGNRCLYQRTDGVRTDSVRRI